MLLRQSTAVDVLIGPFVDSTDGYTPESGVSPAVKLSKAGQALAAKTDATTPVHDADGYYNCELDATDTNTVGTLVLSVVGSATSLAVRHEFQVVEEAVYDAMYVSGAVGPLEANDTGTGLTAIPWNASWDAEVQSECNDALVAQKLDHLVAVADANDPVNNSIIAKLAHTVGVWASFNPLTDSLATISGYQTTLLGSIDNVEEDTQDIQARIPAALVGGLMSSDVTAVSTDTTAADNLELMYDGTGYTHATAPASVSALATVDANVDLILADTGTDGVVISAATANQVADALLKRDFSAVSGESARSALNALRFLRNKWSITGSTLTVTEEDDSTPAWTGTVSTDAAADPVTGNDPA